jgi:hypothetical protein
MPAPLAPQSSANAPYAHGSHSMAQRGRPSGSDNRMTRDASLNAASKPASNWYPRSSQTIPNSAERPVRVDDTSSHTILISFPLLTRRTGRKSNARVQFRRGYRYLANNVLIQALLMIPALQWLLLSFPVIFQLTSLGHLRGHLRIFLPAYTYRSHQPDILLQTPHRRV